MVIVGLDLHVRNSFLSAMDLETGEVLDQRRIPNTREAIRGYFGQFDGQEVKVTLEATTNTYPMVSLLRQMPKVQVVVVHPRKMKIIAEGLCKTDKVDSEVLVELGRGPYRLPTSYIPNAEVHDLRCELRTRARLVVMRTELKNRVHGLLTGEGFFEHPAALFGKRGREWLSQVELSEGARRRLDRFLRLLDRFEAELVEISQVLREHYARAPLWEEDVKLLTSMPGIGLLTALTILSELGDWRRFKRPESVVNYAGLVPWVDRSNEKSHYGRLTKQGPRFLRWILAEAAQVARRKVPRYGRLYDRVARKSGAGKATMAVARTMLEHAWLMLLRREKFHYEVTEKMVPGGEPVVGMA